MNLLTRLKNLFGLRTLKTALGAAIAVFLSQQLNLAYAANSGIIAILSVQSTKKRSLDLVILRIGSTLLALSIGAIVFRVMGFTALAFGAYLLFFIPLAVKLKFHDGIVPCSVLVSHILSIQSVSMAALLNEMMQMIIGGGVAILLNLYMPSLEKGITANMKEIDDIIKKILINKAKYIRSFEPIREERLYEELEAKIRQGHDLATKERDNRFSQDSMSYVQYMEIRMAQFEILFHMKKHFTRIYATCTQAMVVADLTERIAEGLMGIEVPHSLHEDLKEARQKFKEMSLPSSREEFENRAVLFEYINDLEHFLNVEKLSAFFEK